jgi:hypothetical protein
MVKSEVVRAGKGSNQYLIQVTDISNGTYSLMLSNKDRFGIQKVIVQH